MQVPFYGTLANYQANAAAYNSSIFISTPLTVDNHGNIFFGFAETGTNPSGITEGGVARVSPTGSGSTYVLASTAAGSSNANTPAMARPGPQ